MSGIQHLDSKSNISFINNIDDDHILGQITNIDIHRSKIWIQENFLSNSECDQIINNCNNEKFIEIEYRGKGSTRLIANDNNNNLINIIKSRLDKNLITNINSDKWIHPYGFNSANILWNKNESNKINKCIRVNKYINSGFDYHRDAQLTVTPLIKSNYTMIIYLNDNYENGETIFNYNENINDDKIIHNGITITQELELTTNNKQTTIIPKKGMCIIFEQGILHKGNTTNGTKYVLRTDLICTGTWQKIINKTDLLIKLEKLTKSLFRQAQLNELNKIKCGDLYEICLSLRQNPELINTYPEHLEKLLDIDIYNKKIFSDLIFIGRSGNKYEFNYTTQIDNKFDLVKKATLFAIKSMTSNISNKFIKSFNDEFSEIFVDVVKTVNNNEFTDIVGKYNQFDLTLLPKGFINSLVSFIRIKTIKTYDRKVFDLTNAITLINDKNDVSLFNNNLIFNNNIFGIISLLNFNNKYDITITSIFKKLFNLQFKLNIINSDNKIYKPLSTLATFYAVESHIQLSSRDTKCDCNNWVKSIPRNIFVPNAICIYSTQLSTQLGDYVLNIYDIKFNDKIEGKIKITAPGEYFNHASCRCEDVRNCYVKTYDIKKYITVEHEIEFEITDTKIILNIIPNIVI